MRYFSAILIVMLFACEGRLSDEQRKKMKEQMELHKIKRVTETEITEAAYKEGRKVTGTLKAPKDQKEIDSLVSLHGGKLRWIKPGDESAADIEQQLIEAYMSAETTGVRDNVQELRHATTKSDSILYTRPVIKKLPDGSEELEGVWNFWLSRKQLILSMDK